MSGVIEDIFATRLRVRQAEFASRQQAENPNAWDTGAAEPGVPIDVHTSLSNQDFERAWSRWRRQWQNSELVGAFICIGSQSLMPLSRLEFPIRAHNKNNYPTA